MGRKCAVPHCYTGYRKCKEKASLYRVPDDDFFLTKWQDAIAREDRPITPKDYVCEKHFKDDDILRRRIIKDVVEEYQRPKLKPDAIPSIFPDLPEFILKMVKKRRKISVEELQSIEKHDMSKSEPDNESLRDNIENEIKTEPLETSEAGNVMGTESQATLNNELDIKSEPEEQSDHSIETEEENEKTDPSFGPKMHQCDQCEYQTKYAHNLRTHKTKHLTGDEGYMYCEHCPKFKTKWELTYRNHQKIKHGIGKQEIFTCNLCPFKTKVKLCLRRHSQRHQEGLDQNLACDFPGCDFKNENKAVLAVHKLSHKIDVPGEAAAQKSKNFKCTECFYETNSKTHIIRHIKTAHNSGDDTIVSVNIQKPRKPSSVQKSSQYNCLKCSYKSKSQSNFMKHVLNHNYPKPPSDLPKSKVWKCPKCPFATFFQHALQKHKEIECGKDSISQGNISSANVNQEDVQSIVNSFSYSNSSQIQTEYEQNVSDKSLENIDGEVQITPEFVAVKTEVPCDI